MSPYFYRFLLPFLALNSTLFLVAVAALIFKRQRTGISDSAESETDIRISLEKANCALSSFSPTSDESSSVSSTSALVNYGTTDYQKQNNVFVWLESFSQVRFISGITNAQLNI